MTVFVFWFGISREETSKTKNKSYINGIRLDKIAREVVEWSYGQRECWFSSLEHTHIAAHLRLCLFHSRFSSSLPDLILAFIGGRFPFACYHFMARLLLSGFPLHGQKKASFSAPAKLKCRKVWKIREKKTIFQLIPCHMEAWLCVGGYFTSPSLFVMRKHDIVSGRRLGMQKGFILGPPQRRA